MGRSKRKVLQDTQNLALELMHSLGRGVYGKSLISLGWTFGFNHGKRMLGVCKPGKRRIELSRHMVTLNADNPQIEDTIRHEIAHAIDFLERGTTDHSRRWKSVARRCGASPDRTVDLDAVGLQSADSAYLATCPSCGGDRPMYRLPKRSKACYECCRKYNRSRYTDKFRYKIVDQRTGEQVLPKNLAVEVLMGDDDNLKPLTRAAQRTIDRSPTLKRKLAEVHVTVQPAAYGGTIRQTAKKKYTALCPTHGEVGGFSRRLKHGRVCRQCRKRVQIVQNW